MNKLSGALRGPQYIKDRQRVIQARDAIVNAFKEYQRREAAKASMPPALAAVVARSGAAPVTSAAQSAQPGTTGAGVGTTQPTQTAPASLGRFPMYSGYQMSAPTVTFGGAAPAADTTPQAKRKKPPPPRESSWSRRSLRAGIFRRRFCSVSRTSSRSTKTPRRCLPVRPSSRLATTRACCGWQIVRA